jgi:hypothetical protein
LSGDRGGAEDEMIDAGIFIVNTLLEVLAMLWGFIKFLFGRIPPMFHPPN